MSWGNRAGSRQGHHWNGQAAWDPAMWVNRLQACIAEARFKRVNESETCHAVLSAGGS